MSNLLSSGNTLTLIGVAVLAVAIVIVAVWAARISGRASRADAQVQLLEKRLEHVEEYLARSSKKSLLAQQDEEEAAEVRPARTSSRTRKAGGAGSESGRQPSKQRRSKREMVVPSGAAKPERPSAQAGAARQADRYAARPSMSQDARRRREERHQAQIRRQAEAIVAEHRLSSASFDDMDDDY